LLQKRAQPVQPRVPEFLIALQPIERTLYCPALELTVHDAAGLFPLDEASVFQNGEMLDDSRQRHADRRGELADRALAVPEPYQYRAPRGIGERAEYGVEFA
jgi:hypothetical protein